MGIPMRQEQPVKCGGVGVRLSAPRFAHENWFGAMGLLRIPGDLLTSLE